MAKEKKEKEKKTAETEEGAAELAPQPTEEATIETEVKKFIDDSSHDRVYSSSTLIQVFSSRFPQEPVEKVIEALWNLRGGGYVIHRHWFKRTDDSYSIPKEQVIYKDIKEFKEEVLAGKQFQVLSPKAGELLKKAGDRDEYLNLLLRTKADFQNYQKRMKKDIDALNRLAVQDVMHAILPVLDNLSRAVSSVRKSDDTQSLEKFLHGVELIQDQFLKALDAIGVKPIHGQEGQAFNPELHEAVMEEENDEFPHHTVLEEVEQGFFLHDKVLRPVKVRVSKKTVAGTEKGKAECTVEGEEDRSTKEAGRGPDSSPKSPSEGSREGVDTDPTAGEEEPIV